MKKGFPESLQLSDSASTWEAFRSPEVRVAKFLGSLEHSLEEEITRIVSQEQIGEGQAARVFPIESQDSPCKLCAKVWKPRPADDDPVKYREIQFRDPRDEFQLQDELKIAGFEAAPYPIVYTEIAGMKVLVMERIKGYTFEQILQTAGAKIVDPTLQELHGMIRALHKLGVAHRDLNPGNIMIETEQPLAEGANISGRLVLIDYGRSKNVGGEPEESDYVENIAGRRLGYTNDMGVVRGYSLPSRSPFRFKRPGTPLS